jgi:UDP-N-acetylglucosamine 2-epimerase (non-hydrolysing)
MSDAFFRDLGLPRPDRNLEVGSGTHAQQTAAILERLEPIIADLRPDLVLVYGDVNSTVAAALVAAKLGVRVGHVEAGLRSRDWTMPEEINRVVTDRLSDLLFAPSRDAVDNLRAEGVPAERIHFVGNIMIDALLTALPVARALDAAARHGVAGNDYVVVTLHRPANVDDPATLAELMAALQELAAEVPVLFPVHPRTRERMGTSPPGTSPPDPLSSTRRGGTSRPGPGLRLLDPLPYLEMLSLVNGASLVITDSGGLQEETTFLGVPCLTVRPNTERPITCTQGTNRLVAPRRDAILAAVRDGRTRRPPAPPEIERWDGKTAERIAAVICEGARFD